MKTFVLNFLSNEAKLNICPENKNRMRNNNCLYDQRLILCLSVTKCKQEKYNDLYFGQDTQNVPGPRTQVSNSGPWAPLTAADGLNTPVPGNQQHVGWKPAGLWPWRTRDWHPCPRRLRTETGVNLHGSVFCVLPVHRTFPTLLCSVESGVLTRRHVCWVLQLQWLLHVWSGFSTHSAFRLTQAGHVV